MCERRSKKPPVFLTPLEIYVLLVHFTTFYLLWYINLKRIRTQIVAFIDNNASAIIIAKKPRVVRTNASRRYAR